MWADGGFCGGLFNFKEFYFPGKIIPQFHFPIFQFHCPISKFQSQQQFRRNFLLFAVRFMLWLSFALCLFAFFAFFAFSIECKIKNHHKEIKWKPSICCVQEGGENEEGRMKRRRRKRRRRRRRKRRKRRWRASLYDVDNRYTFSIVLVVFFFFPRRWLAYLLHDGCILRILR